MKILVIGCGAIGQRHARNASEYGQVVLCDTNADHLLSEDLPKSWPRFQDLTQALLSQPDVVIIATPHDSHLALTQKALAAGAHVLIEKPISHSLLGVRALLDEVHQRRLKLAVVCNMRFHRGVQTIKQNLFRIGKPLFARAHYGNYLPNMRPQRDYRQLYAANKNSGGGVIFDAVHEIDYMQWLFGPIAQVTARSAKLSDLNIDVEDYACLFMQHAEAFCSEIHLDYLQQHKRRGCEVVGSAGTLLWQSEGKNPEHCTVRLFSKDNHQGELLYENSDEPANDAYAALMKNFIENLPELTMTSLASGEEGYHVLQVAHEAHRASQSLTTQWIKDEVVHDAQ